MASFLVGHVEILINFHEFANVDLFHQGLYQIRCHAYIKADEGGLLGSSSSQVVSGSDSMIISATPLKLWQKDSDGCINEKDKAYYTRVFPIQYCDEEIEINEGIIFGVEIDIVDLRDQYAYVDFLLMFAEHDSPNDFALAAYQSIKLQNPHYGLASHFKLTFDSFHFSTTSLTIITTMTDIKRGVHNKDLGKIGPVIPPKAFTPKSPPSLKYINKTGKGKGGGAGGGNWSADAKLNTVYDPERNVAAFLQSDSPNYIHHTEGLIIETDSYQPPKSGAWSEPTIHDFLCYFEASRKSVRGGGSGGGTTSGHTTTSGGGRITDIGEIMKERVDKVGKRFHELLLRNYYFISTLTISLIARAMSKTDLRQMSWMIANPPLRIPGGFTIFAGLDGLPDTSSIKTGRDTSSLKKSIRLYVEELFVYKPDTPSGGGGLGGTGEDPNSSREFIPNDDRHTRSSTRGGGSRNNTAGGGGGSNTTTSGGNTTTTTTSKLGTTSLCGNPTTTTTTTTSQPIRAISFLIPYLPISCRPKIRDNKKTLVSDLQSILIDDINIFWCQISEKWHKLCMILSIANREANFFFEMLHNETEHRKLTQLFRREVILKGNCHTQIDPAQYHVTLAEQHRKNGSAMMLADEGRLLNTSVEDCHENSNLRNVPLIFEEIYEDVNPNDSVAVNEEIFQSLGKTGGEAPGPLGGSFAPLNDLQDWLEEAIPIEREDDFKGCGGGCGGGSSSYNHLTEAMTAAAAAAAGAAAVNHQNPITFHKWVTHLDPKPYEGLHLIVLVHGFRGNSFDLRVFKNYLQRLYPEHIYLLSSSNEGKSDDDVRVQGSRLSSEIMKYIDDLCTWDNIGRVSFICHSLGGLITRAAIPLLISAARSPENFERKLYLYMSLSTPHLGYTAARNRFVDAGLWVLKKWKRSQSLAQLCMCDAKDFRDTFLHSISANGALDKFKKLYFVSSPQDNYVPYESARIELSQRVVNDPLWAKTYEHLVRNIFRGIKNFVRLDVAFKIENKNIDSIIGRTAHINFLSSETLAQMITTHYAASFM